jgi:hypothetical protein
VVCEGIQFIFLSFTGIIAKLSHEAKTIVSSLFAKISKEMAQTIGDMFQSYVSYANDLALIETGLP